MKDGDVMLGGTAPLLDATVDILAKASVPPASCLRDTGGAFCCRALSTVEGGSCCFGMEEVVGAGGAGGGGGRRYGRASSTSSNPLSNAISRPVPHLTAAALSQSLLVVNSDEGCALYFCDF